MWSQELPCQKLDILKQSQDILRSQLRANPAISKHMTSGRCLLTPLSVCGLSSDPTSRIPHLPLTPSRQLCCPPQEPPIPLSTLQASDLAELKSRKQSRDKNFFKKMRAGCSFSPFYRNTPTPTPVTWHVLITFVKGDYVSNFIKGPLTWV